MTVGWLLWPIVLLVHLLVQASRRVLQRWRWITRWFMISVALWLPVFALLWVFSDSDALDNTGLTFDFTVRWWRRLTAVGLAHLLPDGWTHRPPPLWGFDIYHQPYLRNGPTTLDVVLGFLYVALAASITLFTVVIIVLFIRAIVASAHQAITPFGDGRVS